MRELSPEPGSLQKIQFVKGDPLRSVATEANLPIRRLDQLNNIMEDYGRLDWNSTIIPEHHGPPRGEQQGCTSCHDNNLRGAINYTTSRSHIKHKMAVDLSMPPGLPLLSDDPKLAGRGAEQILRKALELGGEEKLLEVERKELEKLRKSTAEQYQKLEEEYLKEMKVWLLNAKSCALVQ